MPKSIYFSSCILILLLLGRMIFYAQTEKQYDEGEKISFKIRLTEVPQVKYGKQQFRVKSGNGQKITISTGLNPMYQYGDVLKIKGAISQRDYKGHIFTSMNNPTIQRDDTDHNFVTGTATFIRKKATKLFQENLTAASAGLLNGIIFGGNQDLPQKFLTQLRVSGVIHVIAASGMNVTFVASALIGIMGAIFKRQIALTIAIFGVVFYAFLAGFEPSIVRAAIMSVLAFSASLLGRQNFALISVFLTGYIMLIFSPYLLSDVGFQLSFLSTLGILVIKPLFPTLKGFPLLEDIWTTVAAQVATLPILLSVFGSYGILSIVVNALVLWTVPVLMVLGSLAILIGIIFEPVGRILIFFSEPILFYFEKVVAYFGNLGWTLSIPEVSGFVWIGYYLLLISAIVLVHQHRTKNKYKRESKREILT